MSIDDLRFVREDFPMLQKQLHGRQVVYLDSAATSQKPLAVIEAMDRFYREDYATVHRAVYELAAASTDAYSAVREQVRQFLNAQKTEEVLFTRGTTESINLVASSYGKAFIQPGDEVVISTIEHHSNIVPWQLLCEDRGARLRVIPVDDSGVLDLDAYRALLNEKTRIVAVNHIANSLGTINPIQEMASYAHAAGAHILVDGAQAAPHMVVDVQALDADFYVFSGHKALGPTGIGVLYGKESLLEEMPPYQGGGDMIERVSFEKTTYNSLPLKFEAGTPMIVEVIGLGAAIQYLQQVGLERIHEWEGLLLEQATRKIQALPNVKLLGTAPSKGAILSFIVEGAHPLDVGTFLDLRGICVRTGHHCAQPTMERFGVTASSRASFAFYNTPEEVDYFIESLEQVVQQLV